jgi:hypothetical protein
MTIQEWLERVRETWQPFTPEQITVIQSLRDTNPSVPRKK